MKLFKPYFFNHQSYHEINKGRLQSFMQQALPHLIASVLSTFMILWMFYEESSYNTRITWIGAISILMASMAILYGLYATKKEDISLKAWSYMIFCASLIWGIVWALVPLLFFDEPLSSKVFFVYVVTGSMFTIPAHSMASFLWAYVGFMTPIAVSIVIYILFISPSMPSIMAYMILYLWVTMIVYGYSLHRNIINLIILKIENENSSQLKSRFLATASHDIRQPLQSIHLFLNVLKKQKRIEDPANNAHFQYVEQSVDNMSSLLDDLLQVSKIDNKQMSFSPSHFFVAPIIKRIFDGFKGAAENKGLELEYSIDDNLIVHADLTAFERVLNNLVSNAIRYTEKGKVQANVYMQKNHIHICVKDTGIGINEQTQASMFEDFYRGKQAKGLSQKGLGLGLAIVKRLCDTQNWRLSMNSIVGKGSQFCFFCPKGEADKIKVDAAINNIQFSFKNYQAMLIDDNLEVRTSMQTQLKDWGLKTETFSSFQQAISYLKTSQTWPDLIISDNEIDKDKGIEKIQQINGLYPDKAFKYLMLSGDTSQELLEEAQQKNIVLLHKPIKPAQLKNSLRQILQTKGDYIYL